MPKILWVNPNRDEWWVSREGAIGAEAMFDSRDQAIDWACRVAHRRSPCLVRVRDDRGAVVAQFLFEQAVAA